MARSASIHSADLNSLPTDLCDEPRVAGLPQVRFIGVDLGWSSGATGLSCLNWDGSALHLRAMTCRVAIADILTWIQEQTGSPFDNSQKTSPLNNHAHGRDVVDVAVVAVDAPTIIPNATGMRLPDRLAHQHFRRYHAGCYPANMGRPFAERTVAFGHQLESIGFTHQPHLDTPQPLGFYQLEVFPHAATIHLFQLSRILKYKKGRLAERRDELLKLRELMTTHLPQLVPALQLHASVIDLQSSPPTGSVASASSLPSIPLKGQALKAVEDQLDSLICAYTAAHWWYWGQARNWVLGDRTTGYIVVPTPFGRLGN